MRSTRDHRECDCPTFPSSPCTNLMTQEDLLCDECRPSPKNQMHFAPLPNGELGPAPHTRVFINSLEWTRP